MNDYFWIIRFVLCFVFLGIKFSSANTLVPFDADVKSSCTITLLTGGTMVSNGTTKLSSSENGGRAGKVAIFTTGEDFHVSLKAPTDFQKSPAGVGDVRFSTSYSSSGATVASDVEGSTSTKLGRGASNVSVNLVASASGFVFPNGKYSTNVTVLCE